MPKNPLAEVFGFRVNDMSPAAMAQRSGLFCPFHNPSGDHCTKNSATDPLGVCTVYDGDDLAITCPVRLRQDKLIMEDAAQFFFPGQQYTTLTEARLKDAEGKPDGNIDIVIVLLDDQGQVKDFGAIEIQAVYISGNVGKAFKEYMRDPALNYAMTWPAKNYPRPDYLSSSRKRLVPQLMFKGGILHQWGKKMAVAVHSRFFEQLPALPEVAADEAEIAWLIYDLELDEHTNRYQLQRAGVKYTRFDSALDTIARPAVGDIKRFVTYLETRIKKGQKSGKPTASPIEPAIEPPFEDLAETFGIEIDDEGE